uniref:Ovule protein n=1 Tax=Ascaris lumbricoides TaxID=6252 RepID=A0A0M3HX51_ASCLU
MEKWWLNSIGKDADTLFKIIVQLEAFRHRSQTNDAQRRRSSCHCSKLSHSIHYCQLRNASLYHPPQILLRYPFFDRSPKYPSFLFQDKYVYLLH